MNDEMMLIKHSMDEISYYDSIGDLEESQITFAPKVCHFLIDTFEFENGGGPVLGMSFNFEVHYFLKWVSYHDHLHEEMLHYYDN